MSILEKTMAQMPNSFTSNQFNKKAIQNGYPEKILKGKGLHSFIGKYADNAYKGSRTWIKRSAVKNGATTIDQMTIDQMISFLKSKGYRIMKPVSDWVEV